MMPNTKPLSITKWWETYADPVIREEIGDLHAGDCTWDRVDEGCPYYLDTAPELEVCVPITVPVELTNLGWGPMDMEITLGIYHSNEFSELQDKLTYRVTKMIITGNGILVTLQWGV